VARGEAFVRRLWLLALIPAGLTTWASFLYIGIRARRKRWLAWSAIYALGLVAFLVVDTNNINSARDGIAAALWLLTWIGGGIHGLAISGGAVRRIYAPRDPLLEAGKARIARRAEGRHLLATQPSLAKEIGLGRPDLPGSDDYGLVDVNHCTEQGLQRLPGVDGATARQIAAQRTQCGGFSSVEDLGMLLNLPPDQVGNMRDAAVFIQD
jgi:Helix-hairpin-helix motif